MAICCTRETRNIRRARKQLQRFVVGTGCRPITTKERANQILTCNFRRARSQRATQRCTLSSIRTVTNGATRRACALGKRNWDLRAGTPGRPKPRAPHVEIDGKRRWCVPAAANGTRERSIGDRSRVRRSPQRDDAALLRQNAAAMPVEARLKAVRDGALSAIRSVNLYFHWVFSQFNIS